MPHLPELKADVLGVLVDVQVRVRLEVWVVDIRGNPDALVGGVVDLLLLPGSLVLWVGDDRGLPCA
jgi:hypothetical protein